MMKSRKTIGILFILISLIYSRSLVFPQVVKLNWTPSHETDVSHFNVYRSIHNKLHFHLIGSANYSYATFIDSNIHKETSYFYAATVVQQDGTESLFSNIAEVYLGIRENNDLGFALKPVYPNPFNPLTNISFRLAKPQFVTVKVFDIRGQEISTLLEGDMNIGLHKVVFDGKNLMNGVYFVSLNVGGFVKTQRMILLK